MSEILNVAHDMAKDLFKVGAMDKITMREIDRLLMEGIESGKATPLNMLALQKKATTLLHKKKG